MRRAAVGIPPTWARSAGSGPFRQSAPLLRTPRPLRERPPPLNWASPPGHGESKTRDVGLPPSTPLGHDPSKDADAVEEPRPVLTLAIETSCDDTCVALLEKCGPQVRLLLNTKITSDNRKFGGVQPVTAVESHMVHLPRLVKMATLALPKSGPAAGAEVGGLRKPDFVSVTRGPGMTASLSVGLAVAKGLAVAWNVPLVGVHHMQAHALTPRLVNAMKQSKLSDQAQVDPAQVDPAQVDPPRSPSFPFLSLLVSGGHTLLLLSRSVTSHAILAESPNVAIGDMLDKCARAILPDSVLAEAKDVMYGAHLETFAFPPRRKPKSPPPPNEFYPGYVYNPPAKRADEIKTYTSPTHGWSLTPPFADRRDMAYDFSGLGGMVQAIMQKNPDMDVPQRQELAREAMRLAFEHLASRVIFALDDLRAKREEKKTERKKVMIDSKHDISQASPPPPQQQQTQQEEYPPVKTLVVSGGVASNRFLRHILQGMLRARGYPHVGLVCPPPELCTDNAAMIAWAGLEMYEAGWHTELGVLPVRKWSMDDSTPTTAGVGKQSEEKGGSGGGGGGTGGGGAGGILGLDGWLRLPEPELGHPGTGGDQVQEVAVGPGEAGYSTGAHATGDATKERPSRDGDGRRVWVGANRSPAEKGTEAEVGCLVPEADR